MKESGYERAFPLFFECFYRLVMYLFFDLFVFGHPSKCVQLFMGFHINEAD